MATKCPNKNSPEWIKLVDAVGEDMAWKVFLANNEEVPEMSVIDDVISITTVKKSPKEAFIERMNSRIENGMYKERSGKLVPITESYNPETWWIENTEKLVDFETGVRKETLFKFSDAHDKAVELNQKYRGQGFTFVKEQVVFPAVGVAKSKNPSPNNRKIYRIKVTQVTTQEAPTETFINETDVENSVNERVDLLLNTFNEIKGKSLNEVISILSNLEVSDEVKQLLGIFAAKLADNPTLKIDINEKDAPSYADYDPTTNTITLYKLGHINVKYPTLNSLGISLVHELIHAYTLRAFRNRYTESEIEFANTIERLYEIAKKRSKYKDDVFYQDAEEWLAYVLSDPTIMDEAMKMELNVWERILLAIKKVLGITSVHDLAFRSVVEHLKNNDTFVPSLQYTLKFKRSLDDNVYVNRDNETHKSILDKLKAFANQFEFNEAKHTYTHKPSNQLFNSVTEMMTRLGINSGKLSQDEEKKKIQLEKRKRGADIGSVIHNITEADLKQTAINIAAENGFKYDDKVVKQIEQILRRFKRPGVTILSEVLVADTDLLLAGTIDMVVIDENNQIHVYDFKTKEKGFIDYLKQTKFGGSQLMSDKERHAFQVSAYKDMLEKMTGLKVADLNIVTLKPTISKDNVITDIELDKTYFSEYPDHSNTGIVTVDYNYSVRGMYGILKIDQGKSIKEEFDQDKVSDDTRKETEEKLKKLFEQLKDDLSELSDKEKIVNESIKALIRKRQVLYRSGKRHELETQDKIIDDLLAEEEVEKQLIKLVEFAYSNSKRIYDESQKYKKEGKEIPLNILYSWKDSVSAFNALLNEEEGLQRILTKEHGFKGGPKYRKILKETMDIAAQVKSLYETEGLDKLVDFLAPYYNRLYAELRLAKIKEYRRNKFLGKIPAGMTESQYVDKAIDENEENLQTRTKTLIRKELKKAYRDIGVLTRWIDNLLDSQDPVTAAMVKAFVIKDEEQRLGALNNRDETAEVVRKVELWYKKNGKIPKSNEEFYGFMLEKIDGKLTGHYVKPYVSAMMQEYRDIIKISRNFETPEQRKTFKKDWLDINMPLDKDAFRKAYWEYIDNEVSLGNISDEEYNNLYDNDFVVINKLSIGQMVEKGFIKYETGDILGKWLGEHTWDFREPSSKWKNPQYDALKKILEDPTDARGDLYRHIERQNKEADSMIPLSFRLDSRLPGVIKQDYERIDSGQPIGQVIKGALSRQLTFKVDDTSRIHEELTDEAGNPKYFLPIHFTGRITKEVTKINSDGESYTVREFDPDEQSFDLATIYHKYWCMANDYNHKAEILPQMELAKFMINKRKAIKRDSLGNAILRKRSRRKDGNDLPEEESTINNTLLKEQVNDWFLSCVYGVHEQDEGKLWGLDVAKMLNTLNSYVSLNLLGVNVVAGTANIILGETLQRIESFAKEYMDPKDFLYADKFYFKAMKGMIGDIGARDSQGLGTHLIEYFGVLDDYGQADMDRRTKFGQMISTDTLYFTSHLGEHYMQSRFLFGLLAKKRAYDKDGKDIGRMLDQYELKNGKLVIKDIVDLDKSKWTKKDQDEFKISTRGVLSRLHGEYGALGKVAIQRVALGRMAYLFRHFIVPGFRRRWGKKAYIERLGQFVEGNYITTGKFIGTMGSKIFGKTEENKEEAFFSRFIGNLQSFKMSMFGEEWAALTDHEKANILRTSYEAGFLILAIILANVLAKIEPDDDEEEWKRRYWAFIGYQTYRLQNEMLFFTPKLDSAMSILRSPAASVSFLENLIELSGQIFSPAEVYESGPWKGRPKIFKTLNNMAPGLRQYYRLKDIEVQIPWMQRTGIGGKQDTNKEELYFTAPAYEVPYQIMAPNY